MAMEDEEKRKRVMALVGGDVDQDLLAAYLGSARSLVLLTRHPFSQDPDAERWEPRYDALQCDIAADLYSRRGAEGELSHSENGVDRTWASAGVSSHLLSRIVPLGRVTRL